MNKSYRTVWNASTGTWGAADELARGKTKGSSRVARNAFAAIALGGVMVGGASAADVLESADALDDANGTSQTVGEKSSTSADAKIGSLTVDDSTNVGGDDSTRVDFSRVVNSPASTNVGVMSDSSASNSIQTNDIGVMGGLDGGSVVGTTNVAIGPGASVRMTNTANPTNAIAIGNNALVGDGQVVDPSGGIAIGAFSRAGGGGSIVVGQSASNDGSGSVAIGSSAYSQRGVAVGSAARGSGNGSTAVGNSASASGTNSVALGASSVANRGNSVSVGSDAIQRQIVNVAAGTEDTDAVNFAQMNAAIAASGANNPLSQIRSIGATPATAATDNAIAIGGSAYASNAYKGGTLVNGGAVAIGEHASATAGGATAVGGYSYANTFSSAFGDMASASGENSSAFGSYTTASAKDSVALGSGSVADRDGTVSVGSTRFARQIVNVAAGTQQGDAVNVAQLAGVVGALGGGAAVNPDGTIEAPTYTVGGTNVRNIGDALSNLDDRTTDLADRLANSGLIDPVTGAPIAAVTYDDPTKASVTLGGADATGTVTLKNVAAGVDDHDAVNVAQLKSSGLVGEDKDGNLTSLAVSYDNTTRNQITLGGAGATTPVALKNVAKGVDGTDAVNVDQLTGATQSIRDDLATGTLDMRYIKVNATGVQANAAGTNAVAIGSGANANGVGALALGTGSRAQGVNSVALGFNSVATQANTVSVGRAGAERKVVNVANGDVNADSTDAINGSQLYDALNSLTSTFDQKTQQLASNSLNSIGVMDVTDPLVAIEGVRGNNTASLNGSDPATTTAVAVGSSSVAAGGNAVAVGLQNVAGSNNAVAIGSFAQTGADSDYATAIGSNVQATGSEAVAMGANVEAGADNALVIGSNNARAIGAGSVALGNNARVNGGAANSIAVGTNAAVATNVTNALALGAGATVAAGSNGGVALGQGSVANRGNAVSVGSAATQRQIVNVAAGTAATDAVNVSQLSSLTSALGGGAAVGAGGTVTQPTYTVGGKDYRNVGDALAALAENGGADPNAVAYDDDTKSSVTLGGTAATDAVALKNVAAGAVNATSTDAINGSQLHGTAQSVADALGGGATVGADGKIEAPTYTVGGTDVRTVGDALSNLDGRTTANTGDISDLKDKLADSGLVDPVTGKTIAAVTYDKDATTGAANFDSLTLAGGANGTVIHNVGAGELSSTSKDAVNGSQLFATNQQVGDLKDKLSEGGVFDPTTGESLAVTYTSADKTEVKLGADGTPVRVTNVADAQADNDAVNLKQLKDAGLVGVDPTDPDGGLKSLAVTYDKDPSGAANFDSLTLAGGANGTVIHNVGAGELSATSKDAVNGSQLFETNEQVGNLRDRLADSGLVDPSTGKTIAAVTYDNDAKSSVTLGGTGATTAVALKNIADGVDDHDAVNVSQLKAVGNVVDDGKGNLTSLAVAYDGIEKDKVSLAGADGTTITNLKAGAVNATSSDAINGSQLHGTAQSVADALGGGATVGADGKIEAPTYTVGGTDVRTVGDALSNLDGRTTANTGDISDLKDKLADSGLVDPVTGKTLAAVTYDKDATTGAANFDSLTLAGGTNGTVIHNVGAGELSSTSKDAVNGSQLFATNQQVGDLKDKLSEGGVFDPTTGESLAVTYTSADKTEVKLGADGTPVRVTNVADAQADNDAVNLKQLKDAGLVGVDPTDPDGGLKSLAVTYDKDPSGAANFDSLTLAGGTNGTVIHNVGAGELSATSKDAVNGSQLFATNQQVGDLKDKLSEGGVFDPTTGESLAVTYTNADKTEVKLGADGTPVRVTNVADAQADNDAVNLKQLKDAGLVGVDPTDPDGGLKSLAVTYDKDPSGAANFDSLTLAGGADGTVIHNVGAGEVSATSKDAVNGSQLHGTAQSVADALGGGATVGADGKIEAPTYTVGGTDVRTVGDALSNLDGRTTTNTGDISDLKGKLADSGLVDPATGKTIAAVTYDDATKGAVTLGGTGATTAVALKNVADGVDDHDAVNVSQLKAVGNVVDDGKGNLTSLAVAYDGIEKDKVSLAGADGTTITNLKAGAVNATSSDAINGSQLHGTAQSVADALGGGATVGTDGKIEAPTYTVGGTDVRTVGDALSNLDGRTTANTGDISDLKDKLADSGLVDPATGKTIAAVTYDSAAKNSVTLGGTGSTTPVALKNVATGVDGTDAVNVAQMQSGLSNLREDLTNGGIDLRFIKVNADQTNVAAIANGALAVAIGSGAGATGAHALALGTGARASGLDSVALGYNSVATQANTVSVGRVGSERRIVNVADGNVGFESKDAVNGGQLYDAMNGLTTSVNATTQKAIDEFSSSLDAKTQAAIDKMNTNSTQVMAASDSLVAIEGVQSPNSASLNGADPTTDTAVAIGSGAVAAGGNAVANGLNAMAMSNNATAIGSFAQVGDASDYGVAMGSNVQATGKEAVALGANVEAGADNALAIGSGNAQAVGAGSIALGNHAVVNAGAANSIAVGSNTNIARNVSDALALGSGANVAAGANGGIALGAGSIANRGNALSIGSVGAERQIINVAAGTQQTDAVNVGQLAGVTDALGGSASVGADGSIVKPTYTVNGKTYSNVGDAIVAASESGGGAPAEGTVAYDDAAKSSVTLGGVGSTTPVALKNVANGVDDHDAVNVSQLKSAGLVGNDEDGNLTSLAVGYDDATKSKVTLAGGADGTTITNVAAGAVNATSKDAINGSQLFGTAQSVASALGGGASVNPDGTIGAPTFSVGGTNVHTVGDALTNLDDRTTANTGDIGDLRKQLGRTGLVDPSTGESLTAVTYDVNPDGTAPRSVTLGGADATAPVALKNVADGVDDHDAVNVSQLKATGLVGEGDDGKLTSLVVAYDDANKDTVTLGGTDATAPVALKNVAAGAVNASSTDAVNGSQLYNTAQGVANALGGGATVNEDGSVSAPSIHIGSETYSNVTQAIQAAAAYGATDSMAVKYDVNPDGSTVPLSVTLGGPGSTPIILTNVADGKNQYDAVNYGQLSDLQSNLEGKIGEMDGRVGKLESGVVPGPGDGSGGGSGSGVVGGTGGSGDTSGPIVTPNPGTGNGNVAIGSGSVVADGANNGTAIGSGSNVGGTGGTAIGSGSNAKAENSTAIGQGSSASGSNSVAIGAGSVATEANTVSFGNGTDSGNRRLVNIADGVNASDAATKGQLDRAMGGMQNQVNDLSRNAYSGIAAATALTMIPGVDPGKTLSFGIGGATYKGYQAVAFGGEARITQNLKMKAGVGMSSGGNSVGVGASYQW
ncbi:putative hemagglutinin-related autotransporter protein [Burkholderia lata]|uniref:Putative hemagglutinin-related autotransporter protein n=1 Tax=Burkholderia lata (strain ATCC 17760 / DSM 23089 / LMG 22485 / NCIMB 9086 / R18194 / 383) TaxID=482957 RepID=A0A6P2H7F0_BURL3|nr:putative hemagglutinin-related autotransporter protein [Burkholderia lata]